MCVLWFAQGVDSFYLGMLTSFFFFLNSSRPLFFFFFFLSTQLLTTTKLLEDRDTRLHAAHERMMMLTEANARLEAASQQPATPTLARMAALDNKIVRMDEKCRQRVRKAYFDRYYLYTFDL